MGKWITKKRRRINISPRKGPSLANIRSVASQDAHRENLERKRLLIKNKTVETKKEVGIKAELFGTGFEYRRAKTETVTKEVK